MICPHVEAADRDERVQMMGRQPNLLVENAHVEIECAKIRLLEPRKPPEDDDVHADHRREDQFGPQPTSNRGRR